MSEREIITQDMAARYGLTRPWFTQVEMDAGRSRLQNLVLRDGVLYAQTDASTVHAIDAETGASLWAKQIGRPGHPSTPLGVGPKLLALVNGTRLYVVNRFDGKILLDTELRAPASAGPAVSGHRIYVPLANGVLVSYHMVELADPLKKFETNDAQPPSARSAAATPGAHKEFRISQESLKPAFYQSKGKTLVQPVFARENEREEYLVWPTDQGCVYVGCVAHAADSRIEAKSRLETIGPIGLSPTYLPPDPDVFPDSGIILAANGGGQVLALLEKNGHILWRFPVGAPLSARPVAIGQHVYATVVTGGLYCIDLKKGDRIWYAPDIVQFVAAGKDRLYAADRAGAIRVLDAANGRLIASLPTSAFSGKFLNDDTDRIYVYNPKGLIQCLHEIGLSQPIARAEARRQAAAALAQSTEPQKNPEKSGGEAASKEEKPADNKAPAEAKPDEPAEPK